jgi:catechol 2,3-dioxygenase-like lactoylglutathione lyase family enzyme
MEILSSRLLLRSADPQRTQRFYRDVLGLAVYREFGPAAEPGVVFFLGPGLLEVSGRGPAAAGENAMIWLQVRDVRAEHRRLEAAGVRVLREPVTEPWGLTELWIADPDGVRIVLVEVPDDHPLRRDPRLLARSRSVPGGRITGGRRGGGVPDSAPQRENGAMSCPPPSST